MNWLPPFVGARRAPGCRRGARRGGRGASARGSRRGARATEARDDRRAHLPRRGRGLRAARGAPAAWARCSATSSPGRRSARGASRSSATSTQTLHLAELGVVLMLFVIGLELDPKRLRRRCAARSSAAARCSSRVCGAALAGALLALGLAVAGRARGGPRARALLDRHRACRRWPSGTSSPRPRAAPPSRSCSSRTSRRFRSSRWCRCSPRGPVRLRQARLGALRHRLRRGRRA